MPGPFQLAASTSQFETFMVDTCSIYAPADPSGAELDPDTLALVGEEAGEPLYAGKCLMKWDVKVRDTVEGEGPVVVLPTELYIPLSAPAPPIDAVVVIDNCVQNPAMTGRRMTVKEEKEQTVAIARCLYVEGTRARAERL